MPADTSSLRALLRLKIREANEEATASRGKPSEETVADLERLARLIEVGERVAPPRRSPRWPVAAVIAVTALLVSLLMFLRVSETEIELDVQASELGFVLSRAQAITDVTNLDSVRVSGIRNLELPDAVRPGPSSSAESVENAPVRVASHMLGARVGTVTLSPLALPAALDVRVHGSGPAAESRIALSGGRAPVRITVHGPVAIEYAGVETGAVDLGTPKSIVVETHETGTVLELTALKGSSMVFSPQLSVERLTFAQVEEFQTTAGTMAQAVSTILAGTLYLESLNGAPRPLRPRELLQFDGIRGVVRALKVENGHVTINFRGTTRGICSGWGDRPANLMPSYFTWLQAQHGLSLLWGTTIYLFGFVVAILRWWKVPV